MRWRRTGRRRWKWDATGISRSRVSPEPWSLKCSVSSVRRMAHRYDADQSARILIVDDHEDNVELLKARLESWGYETLSAKDGAEALNVIESSLPDLVLLDVMMPKVDGM